MSQFSSVDVVIVGAGAAGLGAARAAREHGLSFLVVEAMDRIGGRAHTDHGTFGFAWDRGCHWLHSADINPMRVLADRYGFGYLKEQPPFRYHDGKRFVGAAEAKASRDYVEGCWERVIETGQAGVDVSIGTLVDRAHPAYSLFRTSVAGEWSVGVENASTLDSANYRDTDHNWPVREGYGALVATHAETIPVTLSTPVRRIAWGGSRVSVETDRGTIDAGSVVITVSTRVIQDEAIAFDPPLPVWKREAYEAIQLGNANKVAFAIDGRELGVNGHSSLWVKVADDQGMFFQLRPFGHDLANGYLAGTLGAEAEREGPRAIIALGLGALKRAYGSGIEGRITLSACTTWQTEPWIRGAYGAARPGQAHKRTDLATPIDDKLFWAGEATSSNFFSTCHGADESGVVAIEAIVASTNRVPV